jgi:OPA family glycerol-3-phosphate transporter-like MFS transporter
MTKTGTFKFQADYHLVNILAWFSYVIAYTGRLNLSITIPWIEEEFGYSKTSLGLLASSFFTAYASGQLINGILGDRFDTRFFISTGLLCAGLSNVCFGLLTGFPIMLISWFLNGYFQSMLWGPFLRTISDHTPHTVLRRAIAFMATSPAIGYFISYTFAGHLTVSAGWKPAFLAPGSLLIVMGLVWFFFMGRYRRKFNNTRGDEKHEGEYKKESKKDLYMKARNSKNNFLSFIIHRKIYLLIILGCFIGAVREGLVLWGPSFFSGYNFMGREKAILVMSFMPLINFFCVTMGGVIMTKKLLDGYHLLLVILAASVSCAGLLNVLLYAEAAAFIPVFYGLMASLFMANNIMTGYLPFQFRGEGRVSAAAGIIDSAFYLGAAVSGPLLGAAAGGLGWSGIFGGLAILCAAGLGTIIIIIKSGSFLHRKSP